MQVGPRYHISSPALDQTPFLGIRGCAALVGMSAFARCRVVVHYMIEAWCQGWVLTRGHATLFWDVNNDWIIRACIWVELNAIGAV